METFFYVECGKLRRYDINCGDADVPSDDNDDMDGDKSEPSSSNCNRCIYSLISSVNSNCLSKSNSVISILNVSCNFQRMTI